MADKNICVEMAGEIHAQHPVVDTTLCSYALEGEGEVGAEDEVEAAREVKTQRITCASCLLIIRYARSIPARLLQA